MTNYKIFELRPSGWETDPAEERFKLSTIDPTPNCAYNHYVLFFRFQHEDRIKAANVLKNGLERTLSQARYLCGTIEKDSSGGHSFVKKKASTVKYVVKCLDSLEVDSTYPSMSDLENEHFACRALGDLGMWSANPWMTWGEGRPEADPDHGAVVAAYQATFIRGGLVFGMHCHHYASDVMGWSNFTRQLADNCFAISNGTAFPAWDPACIDVSRFTRDLPETEQVDGPPVAPRHPDHPEQQAVLFHMPMSKAVLLKSCASPSDGSRWISTYDAISDMSTHPYFGEAVNMRPRLRNLNLPGRMMRNVLCGAFGDTAPVPRPTLAELIAPEEEYPLSNLAVYIRKLTDSCDQKHMEALVDFIAPIRDKRSISLRLDALPPMSIWVTDHRPADVGGLDFGFGKPITHRHLWGDHLSPGLVLIYAPVNSASNTDEGYTFTITMEKDLVPKLLQDPQWTEFFEYRGVD
ncbi:hypothetical protein Daus18300_011497 [Diaporthe australafricana]|uniref:Trichothecene 3-O-acetyltransferase-like N-terminal domain-containing protein n=1 Tax=Diaporthe australafricana TaxID=127596 RepID=A0ABR3W6G8_9PEZI